MRRMISVSSLSPPPSRHTRDDEITWRRPTIGDRHGVSAREHEKVMDMGGVDDGLSIIEYAGEQLTCQSQSVELFAGRRKRPVILRHSEEYGVGSKPRAEILHCTQVTIAQSNGLPNPQPLAASRRAPSRWHKYGIFWLSRHGGVILSDCDATADYRYAVHSGHLVCNKMPCFWSECIPRNDAGEKLSSNPSYVACGFAGRRGRLG